MILVRLFSAVRNPWLPTSYLPAEVFGAKCPPFSPPSPFRSLEATHHSFPCVIYFFGWCTAHSARCFFGKCLSTNHLNSRGYLLEHFPPFMRNFIYNLFIMEWIYVIINPFYCCLQWKSVGPFIPFKQLFKQSDKPIYYTLEMQDEPRSVTFAYWLETTVEATIEGW